MRSGTPVYRAHAMKQIDPKLRKATLRALQQAEDALRTAAREVAEARKLVEDAWTKDTPRPRTAWDPVREDDVSPLAGLMKENPRIEPLTEAEKEEIRKRAEVISKRYAQRPRRDPVLELGRKRR